jgi:hypothetical protein
MNQFTKTVRLGTIASYGGRHISIFCFVEYRDGRLSITGVEGPTASGNCIGGAGQIDMHLRSQIGDIRPAPAWDRSMLDRFFAVWKEHHLNDMKAGSPDQRAFLRDNGLEAAGYEGICEVLAEAGLNPDPNYQHDGQPYRYGSAWLREEVPQDVLDFLRNLPDADRPCPAAWRRGNR